MRSRSAEGDDHGVDAEEWAERLRSSVSDPRRLAATASTGLMDAPPDESFDQLARLAAAVLGVPWVFVTLVDEHRSFWMSVVGVPADVTTGLYGSNPVPDFFCQYVIADDAPVVLADARPPQQ